MTIDYGPPATERRERWMLALVTAFALQVVACVAAIAAFLLAFGDGMGADIADGWYFGLLIASFCVYIASGWLTSRIAQSRLGWLVLLSPLLLWLMAILITKTS